MTTSTSFVQQGQQSASQEALRAFAVRFRQKRQDVNLYSAVLLYNPLGEPDEGSPSGL